MVYCAIFTDFWKLFISPRMTWWYLKRKRKRSDSVVWQKPLHPQTTPKRNVTTQKLHQNFDYTTIADRLTYRIFSWGNDCHPTGVVHFTRGPRDFYRSPDNQQQTVQSEKKTTRMTRFKYMHVSTVSLAIHQYVAANIWSEGGSRQWKRPSSTFVLPRPGSNHWNIWPKPLPEWQHSK